MTQRTFPRKITSDNNDASRGGDVDGKVASLAAIRMFAGWTPTELRRLAKAADVVDLSPGETLVRHGAWHAGCYVLLSGAVVTRATDGSRVVSAAGEFVGLAETLADVAAQGDTTAIRASTLLAFTANDFVTALEQLRPLRQIAFNQLACAQLASRRAARSVSLALAH